MATEVWAKEVEGTGLTVNIVNPGAGANTPGMAEDARDEPRRPRSAARRARRDGAAAALRLARGRHRQRLALRREPVGPIGAAGGSRPPRQPPRRLRTARAAGLTKRRAQTRHNFSDVPYCRGGESGPSLVAEWHGQEHDIQAAVLYQPHNRGNVPQSGCDRHHGNAKMPMPPRPNNGPDIEKRWQLENRFHRSRLLM
jgi:hypothetical protein